jgi:hypothetical protein
VSGAISVPVDELDSRVMPAKAKGRFIDPMLPNGGDRWYSS